MEKAWHSRVVTCIHVECQRLADICRLKQARPGRSGLQLAHLIVAWQGREMRWPHRGHEQGPVVGLQSRRWVQFVERPRGSVGLGLGICPAFWRVRVGVRLSVRVRVRVRVSMSVWVRQARVQPWSVWVHGIGRSARLTVGATLRRGVVTVPEGRGEASSTARWRGI